MTNVADTRAIDLIATERHDRPELVHLAEAACLAVRIEPHLLRRLRIELCPGVDVGVEADLWFSDLMETIGPRHAVLEPAVVAVLRAGLGDRPDRLEQIDRITREEHTASPPSLRLEERLNYLAVRGGPNLRAELNEAFRPALRTIVDGGADARDLAEWALRALPRLFPGALDCENGVALTIAASALLGQRRVVDQVPESDLPIEHVAWALPTDVAMETTQIWLSLVDDGVRIDDSGAADHAIELPATTPLLLELSWMTRGWGRWTRHEGQRISTLIQAEPGRTISLATEPTPTAGVSGRGGAAEVTIRTLAGDEYLLAKVEGAPSPGGSTEDATPDDPPATAAEADATDTWKRAAIVVGVDIDDDRLIEPPQSNSHNADALQARLAALGYHPRSAGAFGLSQRAEIFDAIDMSEDAEVLWVHVVGPGRFRYDEDAPYGGLHSIGLADADGRLEWLRIEELFLNLSFPFGGVPIVTIEVTSSASDDPENEPVATDARFDEGVVIVAVTNGGAWEEHGPLTHLLLDALPDLGPQPQLTVEELVRHVRTGWNRWADNNDYERDTLTIDTFGEPATPLVGSADDAWFADLEADAPTPAPELPPDVPRIVDLATFDKLAESAAEEDRPWFDAGRDRAGSVCTVGGSSARPVGTGFLVRAGDIGAPLPPDELLVATASEVARIARQEPPPESAVASGSLSTVDVTFPELAAQPPAFRVGRVVWFDDIAALLRLDRPVDGRGGLEIVERPPTPDGEQRVYLVGDLAGDDSTHVAIDDNEVLDVQDSRLHYRIRVEPGSAGSPVFDSAWNVIAMHLASSESMPRLHGVEGVYAASEGITMAAIRERYQSDLADEGFGEQGSDDEAEFAESPESDAALAGEEAMVTAEEATLYDEDGEERSNFEPEILSERGSGRVTKAARRLWNRVTGGPDDAQSDGPKIFVSYVRDDSGPWTNHVVDRLRQSFGVDAVWRDMDDLGADERWGERIAEVIRRADIVLAMIGPDWTPSEWTMRELELAFRDDAVVIPVLVGGADFPEREALAPEIQELWTRQAVTIQDAHFDNDIEHLERTIRNIAERSRRS